MDDLELIHSFLEVAETGSVTQAARRLNVTQPALSRRLHRLESALGAELFERSRSGVALTEQGRFVQREGHAIVQHWSRMKDGVAALTGLEAGTIRIGGGATAASFILPGAIAEFQGDHPGVLFHVKEAGSRDIEHEVAAERLDLGIVTLPVHSEEFELRRLRTDRIVLVGSADHPLAKRSRIPVSALDGQELVGFESPSAIRQLIDGALRDAGVQVKVVMELRSIPAILRMVAATHCLAFVSQMGVGSGVEAQDLRVLSVSGLKITRGLAVIRKRNRPMSPAAESFARRLRLGRG
ncbi:MAG: DNA-binding transcriptional LysR family regulator [Planctomycetota bacterium]|jgi:DNA-binding transcriptional LysR family regulator